MKETTESTIQTLATKLESLTQTLQHHITEYEKIDGIDREEHPKYDVFLRAQSRLKAATAEAERDEPLLRQQIQDVTESINDLSPEKPEETFFLPRIPSFGIKSTWNRLVQNNHTSNVVQTQTAPLLPTEITIPPARSETPHSQQSSSTEDSNIPEEPSLNQELKNEQERLTRELLLYTRLNTKLNKNLPLQAHYEHLILAARNAENINIILLSPEEALKRNLAHCYTLHSPTTENNTLSDSEKMQLSYIATDGSVIPHPPTCSDPIVFFRKKGIEIRTNNGMHGMSVPTAVFRQYLTSNNSETQEEINIFLTNLIQKLQEASEEVKFHRKSALLQTEINIESSVEYPECDLYLMPIPEGKQSNYINCYIWDRCNLVYIPPFIWNEEQKTLQENTDGQSEYVNITNYPKLHDGINRLKEESISKKQLTLSSIVYNDLIYNNGGHVYFERKQHDQKFKNAREALEDITSFYSEKMPECDILYTRPPENEIKPNTLYIYKDNQSQLKYTMKRSDRPHTPLSQPKASLIDTFFSYFTQPKPTPIVPLLERIEGDLNLDANPALSRQVEYAINHRWLGYEQEQALWTHIYQNNTLIDQIVYKPKDTIYFQKIGDLTRRLQEATNRLDQYIQDQQEEIETILKKAQAKLKNTINNDAVYNLLQHEHDPINRHIVTLYEEAIRLYTLIPDDHPHQPKLKRLAIAIQQRNINLVENQTDYYSNVLSMHELPAVMRQLNVPFSLQIKQHTERQLNISLMLLGMALLAASVALLVFSHGLSAPVSYMGINLGLHLLFNMTAAGVVSGTAVYATGLFFGPKKVVTESVDEYAPTCSMPQVFNRR